MHEQFCACSLDREIAGTKTEKSADIVKLTRKHDFYGLRSMLVAFYPESFGVDFFSWEILMIGEKDFFWNFEC